MRISSVIISSIALASYASAAPIPVPNGEESGETEVKAPSNLLNTTYNIQIPVEKSGSSVDVEYPSNLLNKTFNIKVPKVDGPGINASGETEIPNNLLNNTFNIQLPSEKKQSIYAFYDLRDVGLINVDEPIEISSLRTANESGLELVQEALNADSYAYDHVHADYSESSPSVVKIAILDDDNTSIITTQQESNDNENNSGLLSDGGNIENELLNSEGWTRIPVPEVDNYVHATYLIVYNVTQYEIDNLLEHVTNPN